MLPNPIPYCGPAPEPSALLLRWNLDPVLLSALGAMVAAYVWDLSRRENVRQTEILAFACAWLTLILLFVSPLCAWSSSLFSVRVSHHVALITITAPLLALARPMLLGGPRVPVFALHAAALWLWHVPSLYEAALANHAVFWTMQLSLLGTAVLLWQRVLSPAGEPGRAIVGLIGTTVQMGLLGALITFAGAPLYTPHFATTAPWGLSALEDQQLAGLIMWVPSILPYLAAGLWLSSSFLGGTHAHAAKGR